MCIVQTTCIQTCHTMYMTRALTHTPVYAVVIYHHTSSKHLQMKTIEETPTTPKFLTLLSWDGPVPSSMHSSFYGDWFITCHLLRPWCQAAVYELQHTPTKDAVGKVNLKAKGWDTQA